MPFRGPSIADSRRLDDLLARPDNHFCADCGSPTPRWAVVNVGVFVCYACGLVHSALGMRTSLVKSVTLDAWGPCWLSLMADVGNAVANSYYEHNLPPCFSRPSPSQGTPALERFIRSKYVHLKFIPAGQPMPPCDLVSAGESPALHYRRAKTPSLPPSPVQHVSSSACEAELPKAKHRCGPKPKARAPEKKRLFNLLRL
ncbi:hypothetical protein FOZ63_002172 [Perkinsus olseni]|uniref:Arf-GAP domain-containing protein n=1 Tax=Perkinsus olseni TaxID=32597 RepID=A0A7J6UEV2_PEROL|nr:hypothetical protein FOZ63_002172 [Perkinsus olseni]KAF4755735.1 hypothetical protein FOZ62_031489 [Perkinsus olseni]